MYDEMLVVHCLNYTYNYYRSMHLFTMPKRANKRINKQNRKLTYKKNKDGNTAAVTIGKNKRNEFDESVCFAGLRVLYY